MVVFANIFEEFLIFEVIMEQEIYILISYISWKYDV